ncbi:MAG: potassium transporter Kup [Bdellovibrionales bacterium]
MDNSSTSSRLLPLTIGALGVVFGDIGTSPLYALRECFSAHYGLAANLENILGILSLVIWTLILVFSIKYILFVLRADNNGEGGILALLSLALPKRKTSGGKIRLLLYIGIFGSALLYGDGVLTPAVTVLSAIEGLKVATPVFDHFIVSITVCILALVFYFQSHGTQKIGFVFGPVIICYFAMLAALGLPSLLSTPQVLNAFNPLFAFKFFVNNGIDGYWVMGSVFLAVTGCEALYADMGHFGKRPIQVGWYYVVFPALIINYLGQGALLIQDPSAAENPFFKLAPPWALYPVVVVATLASIIASQALISGAFSLTRQAILLGYWPRLRIIHTSSLEIGQIYIPAVNWALMIGSIWLVLEFKSSSALAGAYGIAVSLTMLITTILVLLVTVRNWHWSLLRVIAAGLIFIAIDLVFLGANIVKIPDGGWFPLLCAAAIFTLMTTWKTGRRILALKIREQCERFSKFAEKRFIEGVYKVPGISFFMSSDPDLIPPALARNIKYNRIIHERIVVLSVVIKNVPRVKREHRAQVETFREGLIRVTAQFGFMEDPSIQEVLEALKLKGHGFDLEKITFFLGKETIIPTKSGMAIWRDHLFSYMSRNSYRATQFFNLPPNQVVEIGSQVEL